MTDARTAELTHYRALNALGDAHAAAIAKLQDDLAAAEAHIMSLRDDLGEALVRENILLAKLDALAPPF